MRLSRAACGRAIVWSNSERPQLRIPQARKLDHTVEIMLAQLASYASDCAVECSLERHQKIIAHSPPKNMLSAKKAGATQKPKSLFPEPEASKP